MIAPGVDELAGEYAGKVRVGKVDVQNEQALAAEYGVHSIPTLLIFKGGQVIEQMVGLRSKRDLKASLDKVAVS
jgi:thioredoxin 1